MLQSELEDRNSQLYQGIRKVNDLKNMIAVQWETLENDLNINKITRMEDELAEKQLECNELRKQSKMHAKVISEDVKQEKKRKVPV